MTRTHIRHKRFNRYLKSKADNTNMQIFGINDGLSFITGTQKETRSARFNRNIHRITKSNGIVFVGMFTKVNLLNVKQLRDLKFILKMNRIANAKKVIVEGVNKNVKLKIYINSIEIYDIITLPHLVDLLDYISKLEADKSIKRWEFN